MLIPQQRHCVLGDGLRNRDDFKTLLAGLESAKAGEQKPKP
jgi:hypothetical protein